MRIFIDPGHGGNDPGATGIKGTRESDVVLMVGKALQKILVNAGFETDMSRTDNIYVSLMARAEKANSVNADLFISLHCNGFSNSAASGTEVYIYNGDNRAEGLADKILEKICGKFGTKKRGVKKANFAVLRLSKMASVLVETAFITNAAEENMMLKAGYADEMALVIAQAICEFLGVALKRADEGDHWGKKYLENLQKKGLISDADMWSDFDGAPTTAMVLALADKITEVR